MKTRTSHKDPYSKEDVDFINEQFMRMVNQPVRFNASVATIIQMINSASDKDSFDGEMAFYSRIVLEINEGNVSTISTEEREMFMIMHLGFIDVYKELSEQS